MLCLSELISFYHELLVIAIFTTHHDDALLYCGTIYRIMCHTVGTHLQKIIPDPLSLFRFVRLFEVYDR